MQTTNLAQPAEVNVYDYLLVLKKHLKLILVIALGTFLIAAVYTMREKNIYKATAVFYYPLSKTGGSDMSGVGTLGKEEASVLGGLLSSSGPMLQNYTKGILESRKIAQMVIADMNLRQRTGIGNEEALVAMLRGSAAVELTQDGMLQVNVTSTDPNLAADLANGYVDAFREYTLTNMISGAQKHRIDVQQRLEQLNESLKKLESQMLAFEQKNKTTDFNVDNRTMMLSLSQLKSEALSAAVAVNTEKSALERDNSVSIRQLGKASFDPLLSPGFSTPVIDAMRQRLSDLYVQYAQAKLTETPQNPELISLQSQVRNLQRNLRKEFRKEMAADSAGASENDFAKELKIADLTAQHQALVKGISGLEKNFSKFPTTAMEFQRLTRRMKVLEALDIMLSSAYEQAKMDEAKESPDFQILDRAVPNQKIGPNRKRNLMLGLMLGILLGVSAAFFYETLLPRAGKFPISKDGHPKSPPERTLAGTIHRDAPG